MGGFGEGGEGFAGAGGEDEDAPSALGETVVGAVDEAPADAEAQGGEDLDDGVEVELVPSEEAGCLFQCHDARLGRFEEFHDGEERGGVHVVVFAHHGVCVREELTRGGEMADVAFVIVLERGKFMRPLIVDVGLRKIHGVRVAGMLIKVEAPLNVQACHYGSARHTTSAAKAVSEGILAFDRGGPSSGHWRSEKRGWTQWRTTLGRTHF